MTELLLIIPVILFSLSVHEYSHGKAADMLGDPTARMLGRLTLNPIAHLDPIGALVLLITRRFGWAKPVPINPRNFRNPKKDIMLVSLAGPASNIVLALLFSIVLRLLFNGVTNGWLPYAIPQQGFSMGSITYFLINMFYIGITLNLFFAFFNLLPVPPLDGSKILRGVLPYRYQHYLDFLEGPQGFLIVMLLVFTGVIGGILIPIVSTIQSFFLIGL